MKTIQFQKENIHEIAENLRNGKVCLLPSDTLYGLSCLAKNKKAVEKIYKIKARENTKPFIILVPNIQSIENLGVSIKPEIKSILEKIWPAPLTAVFPLSQNAINKLNFLHRGENSLGFRIPNNRLLLELLKITGPLTSTTANLSGQPPCHTVQEVQNLWGNQIDLYIENGILNSPPSTVVSFVQNSPTIVRQGSIKFQP